MIYSRAESPKTYNMLPAVAEGWICIHSLELEKLQKQRISNIFWSWLCFAVKLQSQRIEA